MDEYMGELLMEEEYQLAQDIVQSLMRTLILGYNEELIILSLFLEENSFDKVAYELKVKDAQELTLHGPYGPITLYRGRRTLMAKKIAKKKAKK